MEKKKFYVVLSMTILVFVAMIGVVGVMATYLLTYTPKGEHIPVANETVVYHDENDEPINMIYTEKETFNFLVLGHDRIARLTDVFMLVNYNVTDGEISIMQFPRDTYVGYGVATSRINVCYATFYNRAVGEGSKTPELDALRRLADKIETSLCTKISYCAVMNLNGFGKIVDSIGGVEMNVPADMYYDDPDQGLYVNLKAGYQTLNGNQAEQFVRFRAGYAQADLGRQDAQKIFMSAFLKKVQSSVSLSNITTLADTVISNLYTDITVADCAYFGKNILGVDLSKMTMITMPSNYMPDSGHMVMAKKPMIDLMNKYFNVYDKDIVESIFDKDKMFCRPGSEKVYYSDNAVYGGSEFDAENVNDNSIDIPRK